jgi:hypothetical protein
MAGGAAEGIEIKDKKGCDGQTCEACQLGKLHRSPFPERSQTKREVLELVHTDIAGPISPATQSEKRYIISYIDDATRRPWTYLLRHKYEAFEAYLEFKAEAERQSGKKIKIVRSDNGGEYMSSKFRTYLKGLGTLHQTTAPYTPQQNGVAERFNRTLIESVRCMIKESGLPNSFWGEAVLNSTYTLARVPHRSLGYASPFERWYGKKPHVAHLRPFGSTAYAWIPSERRSKLEDVARRCRFLGYENNSKAWRLWDPTKRKVVVSRDVKFVEGEREEGRAAFEGKGDLDVSPGSRVETVVELTSMTIPATISRPKDALPPADPLFDDLQSTDGKEEEERKTIRSDDDEPEGEEGKNGEGGRQPDESSDEEMPYDEESNAAVVGVSELVQSEDETDRPGGGGC